MQIRSARRPTQIGSAQGTAPARSEERSDSGRVSVQGARDAQRARVTELEAQVGSLEATSDAAAQATLAVDAQLNAARSALAVARTPKPGPAAPAQDAPVEKEGAAPGAQGGQGVAAAAPSTPTAPPDASAVAAAQSRVDGLVGARAAAEAHERSVREQVLSMRSRVAQARASLASLDAQVSSLESSDRAAVSAGFLEGVDSGHEVSGPKLVGEGVSTLALTEADTMFRIDGDFHRGLDQPELSEQKPILDDPASLLREDVALAPETEEGVDPDVLAALESLPEWAAGAGQVVGQDASIAETVLAENEDLTEEQKAVAAMAAVAQDAAPLVAAGMDEEAAWDLIAQLEMARIFNDNNSYTLDGTADVVVDDAVGRNEIVLTNVSSFDELKQIREGDDLVVVHPHGGRTTIRNYYGEGGSAARIVLADKVGDHDESTKYREEMYAEATADQVLNQEVDLAAAREREIGKMNTQQNPQPVQAPEVRSAFLEGRLGEMTLDQLQKLTKVPESGGADTPAEYMSQEDRVIAENVRALLVKHRMDSDYIDSQNDFGNTYIPRFTPAFKEELKALSQTSRVKAERQKAMEAYADGETDDAMAEIFGVKPDSLATEQMKRGITKLNMEEGDETLEETSSTGATADSKRQKADYVKKQAETIRSLRQQIQEGTQNGEDVSAVEQEINDTFGHWMKKGEKVRKYGKFIQIMTVVVTIVNPVAGAIMSAMTTKMNGGSWGDALKAGVTSYVSAGCPGAGLGGMTQLGLKAAVTAMNGGGGKEILMGMVGEAIGPMDLGGAQLSLGANGISVGAGPVNLVVSGDGDVSGDLSLGDHAKLSYDKKDGAGFSYTSDSVSAELHESGKFGVSSNVQNADGSVDNYTVGGNHKEDDYTAGASIGETKNENGELDGARSAELSHKDGTTRVVASRTDNGKTDRFAASSEGSFSMSQDHGEFDKRGIDLSKNGIKVSEQTGEHARRGFAANRNGIEAYDQEGEHEGRGFTATRDGVTAYDQRSEHERRDFEANENGFRLSEQTGEHARRGIQASQNRIEVYDYESEHQRRGFSATRDGVSGFQRSGGTTRRFEADREGVRGSERNGRNGRSFEASESGVRASERSETGRRSFELHEHGFRATERSTATRAPTASNDSVFDYETAGGATFTGERIDVAMEGDVTGIGGGAEFESGELTVAETLAHPLASERHIAEVEKLESYLRHPENLPRYLQRYSYSDLVGFNEEYERKSKWERGLKHPLEAIDSVNTVGSWAQVIPWAPAVVAGFAIELATTEPGKRAKLIEDKFASTSTQAVDQVLEPVLKVLGGKALGTAAAASVDLVTDVVEQAFVNPDGFVLDDVVAQWAVGRGLDKLKSDSTLRSQLIDALKQTIQKVNPVQSTDL